MGFFFFYHFPLAFLFVFSRFFLHVFLSSFCFFFFSKKKEEFTCGQVEGNARGGRSVATSTNPPTTVFSLSSTLVNAPVNARAGFCKCQKTKRHTSPGAKTPLHHQMVVFFEIFHLLLFLFFLRLSTFGQVKGNARHGRSRRQSFRVCKVNLSTLKVATKEVLVPNA